MKFKGPPYKCEYCGGVGEHWGKDGFPVECSYCSGTGLKGPNEGPSMIDAVEEDEPSAPTLED